MFLNVYGLGEHLLVALGQRETVAQYMGMEIISKHVLAAKVTE